MKNIERIYKAIDNSLFTINGKLSYDRLQDAILLLCEHINEDESEDESIWYIGEFGTACLADFITGAYWHFTEWHAGQESKSYACLSALGSIYSPNMATLDVENYGEFNTYELLAVMANKA